jgi:hypothetical protein
VESIERKTKSMKLNNINATFSSHILRLINAVTVANDSLYFNNEFVLGIVLHKRRMTPLGGSAVVHC